MASEFQDPGWLKQERGLISRAKRGDREAFGALYRAFAGALYRRVLLPKLQDPAAAEDALAERSQDHTVSIGSYCTVFAMTEILGAIRAGKKAEDLARAALVPIERMLELSR